jgi:hypothetical protein
MTKAVVVTSLISPSFRNLAAEYHNDKEMKNGHKNDNKSDNKTRKL